jgi:hypothetical protein
MQRQTAASSSGESVENNGKPASLSAETPTRRPYAECPGGYNVLHRTVTVFAPSSNNSPVALLATAMIAATVDNKAKRAATGSVGNELVAVLPQTP